VRARSHPAALVAGREIRLLGRGRATLGAAVLLLAVAWLPALLLPLRSGALGLASFAEVIPLQIALAGVLLPLLALLAGAEMLAGELEDGSLVPILTLPLSRRACLVGKGLGRGGLLAVACGAAFASAGVAIALGRGSEGWADWVAVSGAGLLLALAAGGVGMALGASGRGRVRAFGGALITWVVLVFVLDALLLTAVVALAPPAPTGVGEHGHGELRAPGGQMPIHDPHARHAEAEPEAPAGLSHWLLAINPVSLFRATALAAGPGLRPRLLFALPGASAAGLAPILITGWLFWLLAPPLYALRRFERADLG